MNALLTRTWTSAAPRDAYHAAISRAVQSLTVTRLMDLAANPDAATGVRAVASDALRYLAETLKASSTDTTMNAHRRATLEDIERFLARPVEPRKRTAPLPTPPGDPIGANGQTP